jgi:hypothetical protein
MAAVYVFLICKTIYPNCKNKEMTGQNVVVVVVVVVVIINLVSLHFPYTVITMLLLS